MLLEKKNNVTYKSTLNQMLSYIIKFGVGEGTLVYLYNYIDKKTNYTYPVTILNQLVNPWDSNFYPINLFITSDELQNINIFNSDSNSDYLISSSSLIDPKEVKNSLKDKNSIIEFTKNEISGVFDIKNIPVIGVNTTDRSVGFVDKFTKLKSLNNMLDVDVDNFTSIPDETISALCLELMDKTTATIDINKKVILKLFYSLVPFNPDKMKYLQMLNVSKNEVTSTVYLLQYVKSLVIHNFYKYVDIWSKIPE